MQISVFENNVIAEYKTRKAAEKFAKRVIRGAYIKESFKSSFDMYHPEGKKLYQVCEA